MAAAGVAEGADVSPPFVLGVIGDSGSGKSTIAEAVATLLGSERVTDVRLDDYHRFTREERAERGVTALNPMVHNFALMQEHLHLLRARRPVRNRSYNHANGSFGPIRTIEPRDFALVRGLLGYPTDALRAAYDLAVFLCPEPELLFRWKLRRDVQTRGYSEAEVLKYIAHHLLDAKEYLLPQGDRADVVVNYDLPHPDAGDDEVTTSVRLRRAAAAAARAPGLLDRLPEPMRIEEGPGEELRVRLPADLEPEPVQAWARALFPERYDADRVGVFVDADGVPRPRAPILFVEVLVARLAETMARATD